MFVKSGTGFQKLLDKKPLKIAAYGDSKGFKLLRKFIFHHAKYLIACLNPYPLSP